MTRKEMKSKKNEVKNDSNIFVCEYKNSCQKIMKFCQSTAASERISNTKNNSLKIQISSL